MLLDGKYDDLSKVDWSERASNQKIGRAMFGRVESAVLATICLIIGVNERSFKFLIASFALAFLAVYFHRSYKRLIYPTEN